MKNVAIISANTYSYEVRPSTVVFPSCNRTFALADPLFIYLFFRLEFKLVFVAIITSTVFKSQKSYDDRFSRHRFPAWKLKKYTTCFTSSVFRKHRGNSEDTWTTREWDRQNKTAGFCARTFVRQKITYRFSRLLWTPPPPSDQSLARDRKDVKETGVGEKHFDVSGYTRRSVGKSRSNAA